MSTKKYDSAPSSAGDQDSPAPRSRKEALGPLKDGIRCAWCETSEAEADSINAPLTGICMGDLCYPACSRCLADVANRRAGPPRWAFDYERERWRRRTSRRLPAWDADEAVRVVWLIVSGKRPIPPSVASRGGAATVEAEDGRGQVWAAGGDTILVTPTALTRLPWDVGRGRKQRPPGSTPKQ